MSQSFTNVLPMDDELQPVDHEAHGKPTEELGKDGDRYLDLDSGEKYIKVEGAWLPKNPGFTSA